jgi:uncharacterized protein (DUF1800 family)
VLNATPRNATIHLLNRAAYGPRPGQVAQVDQIGHADWIAQQLDYEQVPDSALDLRLRRFDTLALKGADMHSFGWDKSYIAGELSAATLIRAVYSERQLYERMVGFWTDHFNIYTFKDEVIFLKSVDDREVIRPYALGKFGDLLRASAHSPAMLRYLDNTLNLPSHPNENYAREIMELHTLGVGGGYTEQDVKEVARCLTGWTVNNREEFLFRSDLHDTGAKRVLGQMIPAGGGEDDGQQVLALLINHPSTRTFICTKLVRHFVADDPPASMIAACVQTWQQTDGNIRAVMHTLLSHPDFYNAPPKFKRPFDLVVSFLRAADANYDGDLRLIENLGALGQRPFAWPRPDGYPDVAAKWQGNLVGRWNFALDALAGKLPGVSLDLWALANQANVAQDTLAMVRFFGRLFLNGDLDTASENALVTFAQNAFGQASNADSAVVRTALLNTIALLIAAPEFQWR